MSDQPSPVHALLVVDMQTAFVSGPGAVPDAAGLLERVSDLLDRARAAGALVVHLQNDGPRGEPDEPGTPGWELFLPAVEGPREVVVRKAEDDGFHGTPLAELLTGAGVRELAVCGVMSEMCVSATARTALERDHRVVLPHDAHATYDVPGVAGVSAAVPAALASRAAEWALGDEIELVPRAAEVTFGASPGTAVATVIEGRAVRLRRAVPGDAERFREILGHPAVAHWWGDPHEGAAETCDPPEGVRGYAIESGGTVVGLIQSCEENTPEYRSAGLDIAVHADRHGRGIGGDALHTLARHLIEVAGHHRLTIDPAVDNERAIRLYRRLGFRPVGVMRQYERRPDGTLRDGLLMDLLAADLVAPDHP